MVFSEGVTKMSKGKKVSFDLSKNTKYPSDQKNDSEHPHNQEKNCLVNIFNATTCSESGDTLITNMVTDIMNFFDKQDPDTRL